MYDWRKMNDEERIEILKERKARKQPWHAPPRWEYEGLIRFIVTASCYEHKQIIGFSGQRIMEFETALLGTCEDFGVTLYAWCILPNHYHFLVQTDKIKEFQNEGLGRLHGKTSFRWNSEENQRGRKIWYKSFERPMQSNRHFWASLNYIHNNPVHHGFVNKWQDWAFSSANDFVENFGREKTIEIWKEYPILDYGKDWDIF
jgi:putative transposase